MSAEIQAYNEKLNASRRAICEELMRQIQLGLPEATAKLYHRSPVWFLDGNPVVGYSNLKDSVQLLFWSGQSFDEPGLESEGSFKAAQKRYILVDQIKADELQRWLAKSKTIQWDYKNIVKRRGVLERLK